MHFRFPAFLLFALLTSRAFAQCADMGLSVSTSDTSYVQLYHPGLFLIPSGDSNTCYWTVTTFTGEVIHTDTTSGGDFEVQSFSYFEHTVPVTDSMKATLFIVNPVEGITCTVNDTIFWEEIEILPGSFIGNWAILSQNGGVEGVPANFSNLPIGNQVALYPSHVTDHFFLSGNHDIYSITMFSLNGNRAGHFNHVQVGQTIDISTYPSGMYLIRVTTTDGSFVSAKKLFKK